MSQATSIELLCNLIHQLVVLLPELRSPRDVTFANGLYFFFQNDECSDHSPSGRIVRIGNHPRAENHLTIRLQQHYSGHKNSSVFRRYMGGALLRRNNAHHPCLSPAPGKGHWEKQNDQPCPACRAMEEQVSALLRHDFSFRCLAVDDRALRNRLEEGLVATLSLCDVCKPSTHWLGQYAYNPKVKESGLWNSHYVFDQSKTLSQTELEILADLVKATLQRTGPQHTTSNASPYLSAQAAGTQERIGREREMTIQPFIKQKEILFPGACRKENDLTGNNDLNNVLLLIPCCGEKGGTGHAPALKSPPIRQDFSEDSIALLNEGRQLAFSRSSDALNKTSPLLPAVTWYTGRPYSVQGFRESLDSALQLGAHCLIVSAGYGLLRPDDVIRKYNVKMAETIAIWRKRLPSILADYIRRNDIRRVFGVLSTKYYEAVAGVENLVPDVDVKWMVPQFTQGMDSGAAVQEVPKRVALDTIELIHSGFNPAIETRNDSLATYIPKGAGTNPRITKGHPKSATVEGKPIAIDRASKSEKASVFRLRLEKTYYEKGFFNVTVAYDHLVCDSEGPITLIVGKTGRTIPGKIDRSANNNRTARVIGGAKLRDYFQTHHGLGDIVEVDLSSSNTIHIV